MLGFLRIRMASLLRLQCGMSKQESLTKLIDVEGDDDQRTGRRHGRGFLLIFLGFSLLLLLLLEYRASAATHHHLVLQGDAEVHLK